MTLRRDAGELNPDRRRSMTGLLGRARVIAGAVALAGLIAFAGPSHAQPQGLPVDPDASVVNEQTLLQ
jgi:hypothetical protein